MSLYNFVYGVQPSTFLFLPMLGKHPEAYPRFRDCFIGKQYNSEEKDQFGIPVKKNGEEELISVYTRVGGGNRVGYQEEIKALRAQPGYVEDFDDSFDSTFATFVFKVPDEFLEDFRKLKKGDLHGTSDRYKAKLYEVYPKLTRSFDRIFEKAREVYEKQQGTEEGPVR